MGYVGFDGNGYSYFDESKNLLFSSPNTHEILFDYINKDLTRLPMLLEQYVSEIINLTTFELSNRAGSRNLIDEIKGVLVDAHLYYRHEYKKVIIDAIGIYFNNLLLYSSYNSQTLDTKFTEAWYIKRITALLTPVISMIDSGPKDSYKDSCKNFYNEYLKHVEQESYADGETTILGVPREQPIGFGNEIETQRAMSNMLYIILDAFAQGLEKLTIPQRTWMYGNIFVTSPNQSRTNVTKRLSLYPHIYFREGDRSQEAERLGKLNDTFTGLHVLTHVDIGRDGIPANMTGSFTKAIELARTQAINKIYEEYKVDSLQQLLFLEVTAMIESGTMLRRCRRCGKYFVVHNRKTAYCDRTDEAGLRCSAVGSQQLFQKKLESDEALRIYNRAQKTHYARQRKGIMSESDFQAWCTEAKLKLAKARAGELDIATFQAWLKK